MRYIRYRLDPRLAEILGRLHGTPLGQAQADRLTQLADTAGPSPTGRALTEALRGHQWLLDRAADGGIPLTSAGYLKPAEVASLAAELPAMSNWIFPINREVNSLPVLGFREYVVRTGLLRKYKGTLVLTKVGKLAQSDQQMLWTYLAEHLIPTKHAFSEVVWIIVLLHFATDVDDGVDTYAIADLMAQLGWSHEGGKPVIASDIQWIENEAWDAIGNVGPSIAKRMRRTPSPEAIALIRDALLTEA